MINKNLTKIKMSPLEKGSFEPPRVPGQEKTKRSGLFDVVDSQFRGLTSWEAVKESLIGKGVSMDLTVDANGNLAETWYRLPQGVTMSKQIINLGNENKTLVYRMEYPDPSRPGNTMTFLIDFDITDITGGKNKLPAGNYKLRGYPQVFDQSLDVLRGRDARAVLTINPDKSSSVQIMNLRPGVELHGPYDNKGTRGKTVVYMLSVWDSKAKKDLERFVEFDISKVVENGWKPGEYNLIGRTE